MSERDRPSLSGLAIKRPLAERGRPVVSIDEAESALLLGVEPVLAPAANAASTSPMKRSWNSNNKKLYLKLAPVYGFDILTFGVRTVPTI